MPHTPGRRCSPTTARGRARRRGRARARGAGGGLPRQHHLVTPGRAVEAAVAVGDRVDDVVVVSGVEAGAVGGDLRRGDDAFEAAVRRAAAAGIGGERREPRRDVELQLHLPEGRIVEVVGGLPGRALDVRDGVGPRPGGGQDHEHALVRP